MRFQVTLLACCTALGLFGQEALYNYGDLKIHNGASVGLHLDLVNNGTFGQTHGLVGFYADQGTLEVSGTQTPLLFDLEISVQNGLILGTPMDVQNNVNFISGDVVTPKGSPDSFLNFLDNAFYVGENRVSKANGYLAASNTERFIFPVGDGEKLRPLHIASIAANASVKCAYFYENPDAPTSLSDSFDTATKASPYISISQKEFWRVESDMPSKVTLTWDERSNVERIAKYTSDLKVVGWSKNQRQWVNLGNTSVTGGMAYGTVTSEEFVPSAYEIITLGGNDDLTETFETLELANYFMTPNGDGKNDFLVLEGIETSPNNALQIFDRHGVMVYSKINYNNEFNGYANQGSVVNQDKGLPSGVYYYVITLNDLLQKHQGYLYVSSKSR